MAQLNLIKSFGRQLADIYKGEGFRSLASKALRSPGTIARGALCRYRIRRVVGNSDIAQLADFVFSCREIAPFQVRSELIRMLDKLKIAAPQTILEIGTAQGGTLFLLCRVAAANSTIISIDLPGGRFGGGYSVWRIPLYEAFAGDSQKMHLIRADSHSTATVEEVSEILSDRWIDFLFIDADHSYEGVKRDFELYSPLVAKGGTIGFHDIANSPSNEYGTQRFWQELKQLYPWEEIVADDGQKGSGIGLIQKQ